MPLCLTLFLKPLMLHHTGCTYDLRASSFQIIYCDNTMRPCFALSQAMASGLPVVAAAAGGVPSFISKPGQTGMLFPPGDATNAAAQIEELLADPGAR